MAVLEKTGDYITLFDTTLRDGAQTQGVDFTTKDKEIIAQALDELGIDYIEGGWPGANLTDDQFFEAPPKLKNAKLVAFGMTRRPGRSAENDPVLTAVLQGVADVACLVGKSSKQQVEIALQTEPAENLAMIADSIALSKARRGEAIYDAEHFFDGYKENPDYALSAIKAALDAGARWVVLCDTNGGTLPAEVTNIVEAALSVVPGERLGVHFHNDTENAVANSLAAVNAGARHIQGTLNGLGERCGNANMLTLIATLALKTPFRIGVPDEKLKELTKLSRLLDETLNRVPQRNAAYVGSSAFAHKAGLHVSAINRNPSTYEHVPPESVGNSRQIVMSDQAGRANLITYLKDFEIDIDPKDDRVTRLLEDVKRLEEEQGLTFDGADASFELFARRHLIGDVPSFFTVDRFRVIDERRFNAKGMTVVESAALVQIDVGAQSYTEAATGAGPVEALDRTLRKVLLDHFPKLKSMTLEDYKVRIIDPRSGTSAVTRVTIESADDLGRSWKTVGVSSNIIEASFQALYDAIVWKLLKS